MFFYFHYYLVLFWLHRSPAAVKNALIICYEAVFVGASTSKKWLPRGCPVVAPKNKKVLLFAVNACGRGHHFLVVAPFGVKSLCAALLVKILRSFQLLPKTPIRGFHFCLWGFHFCLWGFHFCLWGFHFFRVVAPFFAQKYRPLIHTLMLRFGGVQTPLRPAPPPIAFCGRGWRAGSCSNYMHGVNTCIKISAWHAS
jgi:hypothetical protein